MSPLLLTFALACAPDGTLDIESSEVGETVPRVVTTADASGLAQDRMTPCSRRSEQLEAPLSEDLEDLRNRFNANKDLLRVIAITAPG